ncbi:hypothetical protein EBX93_04375 [bacterium]|nr:hypothetical protein [bacterium]
MQLGAIQPIYQDNQRIQQRAQIRTGVSQPQRTQTTQVKNVDTPTAPTNSGSKPETIFSADSVKKWAPWAIAAVALLFVLNSNSSSKR